MKTIYKYKLGSPLEITNVIMPADAELVDVNIQGQALCVWALVDISRELKVRKFEVAPTGCNVTEGHEYVGTVHADNGFVWHVFEVNS